MPDVSLNGIEFVIKGSSDEASESVDKLTEKLNGLKTSLSGVSSVSKFSAAVKNVGDSAKKATSPLNNFLASIKRIAFYRMIRTVIKEIAEAIKEGAQNFYDFTKRVNPQFTNYAKALDSVKAASAQMKNQLGAAFGSLYAAIAPIITSLISLVTRFANVLTMIFARLGGAGGWYRATESAADAVSDVGGAAKEALKYLAPFDELNRLPSNNGGGGGGGGGSSGGGYEWVEFEQFDIGDGIKSIVDWFTESFSNMANWLENIDWQSFGSAFYTKFKETLTSIDWGALAASIFEFLGAALGAAAGFIEGIAEGIWEDIKTAFHNLVTNDDGSQKTGEEIFLGILEGIHNAVTNIGAWISENILGPFVEGFCKAFGIASPAKEMEGPGEMIGKGILAGILKPFAAIGTWLNEHIVKPIKDYFGKTDFTMPFSLNIPAGFTEKLQAIKDAWDKIKSKKPELKPLLKGWSDKKQQTVDKLKNAWDKIVTKTGTLTANLQNNVNTGVINTLKNAWDALQNKKATLTASLGANKVVQAFVTAWNNLKDKTLELKIGINDKIKSAWNAVAQKWNANSILSKLGTLPLLAKGGIVDTPTFIGNAIVGEAGKEAIVPLERNTEWIGMVASGLMTAISNASGGQSSESMENSLYNAFVRALNDTEDNRPIYLDGDPIYRSVVSRNKKEIFRTGVNPMMQRA